MKYDEKYDNIMNNEVKVEASSTTDDIKFEAKQVIKKDETEWKSAENK